MYLESWDTLYMRVKSYLQEINLELPLITRGDFMTSLSGISQLQLSVLRCANCLKIKRAPTVTKTF